METALPKFGVVDEAASLLGRSSRPMVEITGCWGSAKTALAVQAARELRAPLLLLSPGRPEAEAIFDDLCTFAGEDHAALFPAWEVLPGDSMNPSDDIIAERMNTLKRLALAREQDRFVHTVLPVHSFLQYVIQIDRLVRDTVILEQGGEYMVEDLLDRLIKMGYSREPMVERHGEVSVRGGIVDIFPISSELPCRVEFFGDEVESIRMFEPETQRSVQTVQRVDVPPRSEKALLSEMTQSGQRLSTLLDYFPENTLVVLDEPITIREEAMKLSGELHGSPFFMPWEKAEHALMPYSQLHLAQVGYEKTPEIKRFSMPMKTVAHWAGRMDDFWAQLKQWDFEGYTVRIFCVNSGERRRLYELLEEQGYRPGQDVFDLSVDIGRLRGGFVSEKEKVAVLSEREIFGRHYMRRTRRRFEAGVTITQFSDLKSGDYVVHAVHGIGRYLGLRRFEGKPGDFMVLHYSGGGVLYVPVTHIDSVQKYLAGEGATPKIDKLGGASWAKTKAKVKKAVRDMTADLIRLYAERESHKGHAFGPDTPWQQEFEDAFEYDETPDQERAIRETKTDMELARPMDRLICGDVGYGKTEVALRAAFKAVMEGKQVALLAPTTVLVQQHYNVFRERLADFPIRVEMLSRFRTPKQIKETVDGLNSGEVDIVVGTHRLTSKDIQFKDLGLLVIDEEQRFGVGHKEKLKQMRSQVDVVTMSATPIPRTLHFSLIGLRDMSVINTAPNDRLPIHTCIEAWDPNLVREAIERELARQGQVFYLHNRVQTIDHVAVMVQKLVPRARVAVGHGQMPKHELEDVMIAFVNKEIDVLVCTTIIGSGIDIPNANTIIIDRADMFGLSELYQIRGRVGRYKHRAFAYLLVPGDRALSEEAQQRLKALEDFSALGSGFRIAMRDLEIRGAGDLLGAEQSGHIATVGYETYRELIAETVAELKGEPMRKRDLPPFELSIDAFVPDEYVPVAQQKMTLYRRIAAVQSAEDVDDLLMELKDRYGYPPNPVRRLLDVMRVRALASDLGVRSMSLAKGVIRIDFESSQFMNRKKQHALRETYGDALGFVWQERPSMEYVLPKESESPLYEAEGLLKALQEV
ncbi:MAG TPA: transcription-repair coupling factor [Candidatus Hydrogenedentes bacterium]|nr:transcription-repair coupling factor [Candidatus Hydrogenedentota bacterium]